MNQEKIKKDVEVFLEALFQSYKYDFRSYAKPSITRRIIKLMNNQGLESIEKLSENVLNRKIDFKEIMKTFSINVTEMFRDPQFFKILREKVIPELKIHQKINIWHAGCSTGEEVYSLAIILKEEGLYDKTNIYATDFNDEALKKAKQGHTQLKFVKQFSDNYLESGGNTSLSKYFKVHNSTAIFDKSLSENIHFKNHNLATDDSIGKMHLILCRNVLIYFDKDLQDKVLTLLAAGLLKNGFLAVGSKESINFSTIVTKFETTNRKFKIYKKK
jgi:chemotaxis protein methyltransferase CheR